MINFTLGPVQAEEELREIGKREIPYFRTNEFSNVMFENERLLKKFLNSSINTKVVFVTGSGTASMEASIINTLSSMDKVLIINGGVFGKRFVDICNIHNIPNNEIKLDVGKQLTKSELYKYNHKNYTALLVNVHETSTGVFYDLDMISEFCKKNNLFFIVDAIGSFLADELDMSKLGIDVVILSSQKGLSCPPGISIIALSESAINRININNAKCYYLNLKNALKDAERGQTPYTPAVSILLQINFKLKRIETNGLETEIKRVSELAKYFRDKIKDLPFRMVTTSPSNAVTSLFPLTANAFDIYNELKDNYKIWVCPSSGELKEKIFRVGHIGDLRISDYDKLIDAFKDMKKRKII